MTYIRFKEALTSQGFTDSKGVKKFTIKSGLFTLVTAITLAIVVGGIISTWLSLAVLVVSAIGFFFLLDYVAQEKEVFETMNAKLRLWWLCLPISVLVLAVMKVFNFI